MLGVMRGVGRGVVALRAIPARLIPGVANALR
jgi:hypothetical protein